MPRTSKPVGVSNAAPAATLPDGLRRVEQIMGMPIGIDVRDAHVSPTALDHAFAWLRAVDATFSTYREDSAISRLNRGVLDPAEAPPEVREVLARCADLYTETGGYFDIQAPYRDPRGPRPGVVPAQPGAVDPSGLVKGWSVDRAGLILEAAGAGAYTINAGGDIRARGRPPGQTCWRVGIQHPRQHDKIAAVVAATNLVIATSGAYERGAHILDPHSNQPAGGVLSVTVVGPDLATADAYATAAYAMGPDGADWLAQINGYQALIILADDVVLSTPGFPRA